MNKAVNMRAMKRERISLEIDGTTLQLSAIRQRGAFTPILFLHGFGSTKEEFADYRYQKTLTEHAFVAYDAPGCGDSFCSDPSALSIPFAAKAAYALLRHYEIAHCHLVGHSMGGLTALLMAHAAPESVVSFCNIEGNLAPEDCFLSRDALLYPTEDGAAFLNGLANRIWQSQFSSASYALTLAGRVRAAATAPLLRSIVSLSDDGDLLAKFLALPCAKLFMYGEQNARLSYLPTLLQRGVRLAEIPSCGHFPMYSNPPAMWAHIAAFVERVEQELSP